MNRRRVFLILSAMLLLFCCAGCGKDGEPEVRRTESRNGQTREKGDCDLPVYFRHDTSVKPDIAYVKAFAEEIQRVYNERYEGYWQLTDLKVRIRYIDSKASAYYVRVCANQESVCTYAEHPFQKGMYQARNDFETEEEKKLADEQIVLWMLEIERREIAPDERLSFYWENAFKVTGSMEEGFEIYSMAGADWRPLEQEYSREEYEQRYEYGYEHLLELVERARGQKE